jgi:hypothetical protein
MSLTFTALFLGHISKGFKQTDPDIFDRSMPRRPRLACLLQAGLSAIGRGGFANRNHFGLGQRGIFVVLQEYSQGTLCPYFDRMHS